MIVRLRPHNAILLALGVVCCLVAVAPGHSPPNGEDAQAQVKIDPDTYVAGPSLRKLIAPLEITRIETYDALNFDPARESGGRLSYALSKPAWVRIRLVSRKDRDLVMRTLVDWSHRKAGKNTETWDGRDAAGYWVNRDRCPGLFLIEGDTAAHGLHDRNRCGDPALRFSGLERGAVLRGMAPVRVTWGGGKPGYLDERGGVLRIYLDYQLVEQRRHPPLAAGALDWEWNTEAVMEGPHLLTLNLDDGWDHVGAASVEVVVRR